MAAELFISEAHGVQLHLDAASESGYKGVAIRKNRYSAGISIGGRRYKKLGCFGSAAEAALAYARALAQHPGVKRCRTTVETISDAEVQQIAEAEALSLEHSSVARSALSPTHNRRVSTGG